MACKVSREAESACSGRYASDTPVHRKMKFPVYSRFAYRTAGDLGERRDDDWAAYHVRNVLKGDPLNGYFYAPFENAYRRFDRKNVDQLIDSLVHDIAEKLRELSPDGATLVPIPNSSATAESRDEYRTLRLAKAVVSVCGSEFGVSDGLRWKKAKSSSHGGAGHRDPKEHLKNLVITTRIEGRTVLFDDFLTTGSQMCAAHRCLAHKGCEPTFGITFARTTHEAEEVWAWSKIDIDPSRAVNRIAPF